MPQVGIHQQIRLHGHGSGGRPAAAAAQPQTAAGNAADPTHPRGVVQGVVRAEQRECPRRTLQQHGWCLHAHLFHHDAADRLAQPGQPQQDEERGLFEATQVY